jgi:peroxiredoxin
LQRDLRSIDEAGIQIVGISYDAPDVLNRFATSAKIKFPLLSDPHSTVIDDYHILNPSARGKAEGVPYPGTFLLDSKGVIRAKLFLEGYRDRHNTEALIKAAKSIER